MRTEALCHDEGREQLDAQAVLETSCDVFEGHYTTMTGQSNESGITDTTQRRQRDEQLAALRSAFARYEAEYGITAASDCDDELLMQHMQLGWYLALAQLRHVALSAAEMYWRAWYDSMHELNREASAERRAWITLPTLDKHLDKIAAQRFADALIKATNNGVQELAPQ